MLEARQAAKKARDFGEADRIRDALKAEGIEIVDTPTGPRWRRGKPK
jgi:cysteinyl-tRNA synthetase